LCRSCANARPKVIIQTQWIRNCPSCSRVITHKNYTSYRNSVRTNRICIRCKMQIQITELRKTTPPKSYTRICVDCGKELVYKCKYNLDKAIRKNTACKRCTVIRNSKIRKPFDREHLSKVRKNYLNILRERKGQLTPNYNFRACEVFEQINKELGWNGQHAENGGEKFVDGYWVDYYEPTQNIVIEFDEKHHEYQLEKDILRQNDIIKVLDCKFIRIKESDNWRVILNEYSKKCEISKNRNGRK
jgi:hypothetical protein